MPRKKRTIIEENLPDEPIELEFSENNNETEIEERELTPAEELSEFIDTLREQQRKDFYIKIFKKYRNKKSWIDTIYEPEYIPDESEIKDRYGSGSYEIMLIYKDPETNKSRVKSITYNIADFKSENENEIDDYENYYEPSNYDNILALMIERDKEFARMQIEAMRSQYENLIQILQAQQTNTLNMIATILSTQRQSDYNGLAELIQTIASLTGVAPQENPLQQILNTLLPVLIPLLQKGGEQNKELIDKLQNEIKNASVNMINENKNDE